ncbi:MAG: alpha/beta fold hydrolase [Euryarchaeota archaeon]|jgi:predicted esterase|nr:alpha/beta fold hydrolase [Euryarchaeota archaeon]MBT3653408.1 alpha/beta fold hydrolase [Euryarchaeota archaeon]MBT3758276.1 alpha/beta fold hydrolase [Euryarchaeota archaeon]MBT4051385.1 alpha/beta fold hydrolase [Euryarchaeota archaeon]MBT4650583.1 alpha/beta fold hydrolase [Euryarchaeota archaeon]
MSGTLVMLHGMTGTSAMMQPLADQIVPSGWKTLCPQAIVPHPTKGGFAWWIGRRNPIEPLDDVTQSELLISVERVISELPDGPLIIGGFSQGGAVASAMLEFEIQERIVGLVLLGTKSGRPDQLAESLVYLKKRPIVWMHGRRDHLVPLEQGIEHAEIFEVAEWPVTRLEHEKGHMVNLNQLDELQIAIEKIAKTG